MSNTQQKNFHYDPKIGEKLMSMAKNPGTVKLKAITIADIEAKSKERWEFINSLKGLRYPESLLDYKRDAKLLIEDLVKNSGLPKKDVAICISNPPSGLVLNVNGVSVYARTNPKDYPVIRTDQHSGKVVCVEVYAAALSQVAQRELKKAKVIKPRQDWLKNSLLWFTRDALGRLDCPAEYAVQYVQDIRMEDALPIAVYRIDLE